MITRDFSVLFRGIDMFLLELVKSRLFRTINDTCTVRLCSISEMFSVPRVCNYGY